ncbi:MAG TPA: L,D-transpeptidase [Pararhizobium sp.]|jgi:lipoprotein-anchoring transpeptidase ErfK/SrfK|nr:L,D-transpeptidase [Pararhizobium sp.]
MHRIIAALAGAVLFAGGFTMAATATATPANARSAADFATTSAKLPAPKFRRAKVQLETSEPPGTVIVDTRTKYLYLVQGNDRAIRYGVGVGREGFGWSGVMHVGRKAEWPDWTPPQQMVARERRQGHNIPTFVKGGENNPLGARALYLYHDGHDSLFRIHGTNQPWSIGRNMSSGCIRMMNADVIDLYSRVPVGARVVVIGPGNRAGNVEYSDNGVDILHTLFGG